MKILVTGANGYLGRGVVKELLNSELDIIATDIKFDYDEERIQFIETNIFEIENPFYYFGKPDIILHLAWKNGFIHNHISHLEDLSKHYCFLEKLIDSGIKQVAVMGSMHEVGFYEGSIKADTKTEPGSLYGIAKNALRQAIEKKCFTKSVVFQWIRGFYIVGNSEYGSSIFSKITQAEKEGNTTFPFTTGENQWDFISYDELCMQIVAIIKQQKYTGIINACSGVPEKLSCRVEKFIRDNNYKIRLIYGAFPDRPYDSKAVWGDNSIISKILFEAEH